MCSIRSDSEKLRVMLKRFASGDVGCERCKLYTIDLACHQTQGVMAERSAKSSFTMQRNHVISSDHLSTSSIVTICAGSETTWGQTELKAFDMSRSSPCLPAILRVSSQIALQKHEALPVWPPARHTFCESRQLLVRKWINKIRTGVRLWFLASSTRLVSSS